jgi:hypothetical protein
LLIFLIVSVCIAISQLILEPTLFCLACLFFFFSDRIGIWTQELCTCKASTPVHFALLILEIGSLELFAWTGLKPWFSQSQPPK